MNNVQLIPEKMEYQQKIEQLLDQAFGVNRTSKISYRYRQNVSAIHELSWVAMHQEQLVGTIRYWPVTINQQHLALLLGPLAIAPEYRNSGLGQRLTNQTIEIAKKLCYHLVFLVGDYAYYRRLGFEPTIPYGIFMPDEKPERLLVRELISGFINKVSGPLCKFEASAAKAAG